MVNIQLTKDMEKVLYSLIGHKLSYFEYGEDPIKNKAFGNLRIQFNGFCVDVTNELIPVKLLGEDQDMSVFKVKKTETTVPFVPDVVTRIIKQPINKVVSNIDVISYKILINEGEEIINTDVALLFNMDGKTIMLSRDLWWSEVITISCLEEYEKIFSRQNLIESFSNDDEYSVQVQCFKRRLSDKELRSSL